MDGKVIIGTELDTKELTKELREAEKELQQYEKEAEKLTTQKAKIEVDMKDFEFAKKAIQEQTDETLKNAQTQEQVNFVLEQESDNLKIINNAYKISKGELDEINQKIKQNVSSQENVKAKIKEINLELIKTEKKNGTKAMFENIGKSAEKVTKRIVAWGLAIIGVRSAYNGIRNAMNVITAQDEQLSADITYMKNAIAYTLEPVIRGIVNLMKQLMFYLAYIVKAWTGKNIFANANKSLKGATGSAKALNKELDKTTASFDEMDVLQDTSSSSGGVGDGGAGALPSFDLSNLGDMKVPGWLQWLVDNKDIVLSTLAGIAMGLVAFNLIDFIKNNKELLKLFPQLKEASAGLMALGIGIAVAGLVYSVMSLLDYLKEPTWENFGKIIQGIGVFVIGLGIAFLGLPGIIAGAIILIVGTIIKYWDEIKAFLVNGIGWLEDSIGAIRDFFGDQVANIYETWITAFKGIIIGFSDLFGGLKQILDGIIQFIKGVFTGNWKQAWEGVKNIFFGILNSIKGIVISVFSFISGLAVSIAQTVGYTIADAFKFVVNGVLGAVESILNSPIKAVNKLIDVINAVPGIDLGKLPTFKLPRLAKGGIINMPGKGIPVGSAIGGERGAEGVIPLTDSQQMALLGEAIGKYINVNATIPVYVGNRQIARELRKINAEDDFAYNG